MRANKTAKWLGMAAMALWLAPALAAQTQPAQNPPPKSAAKPAAKTPSGARHAAAAPATSAPVTMQKQNRATPPNQPAQQAASKPAAKPAASAKKAAAGAKTQAPGAKASKTAKTAKAGAKPAAAKVAAKMEAPVKRRDPFEPLVSKSAGSGLPENLPPGKAGLLISTMRIVGAVKGPTGSIAIVSNPQQRVYFLREGDHVYDGRVEKIALDGVTFQQTEKDAFGKVLERTVTKRIYPSAGEQQ